MQPQLGIYYPFYPWPNVGHRGIVISCVYLSVCQSVCLSETLFFWSPSLRWYLAIFARFSPIFTCSQGPLIQYFDVSYQNELGACLFKEGHLFSTIWDISQVVMHGLFLEMLIFILISIF